MIPFSGNPLNRVSEKRTDTAWVTAKRNDPSSLIFPMWRLQPFILGGEKTAPPLEIGLVRPEVADELGLDGVAQGCRDHRAGQGDDRLASAPRVLPQVWHADQAHGRGISAVVRRV